MTTNFDEYESKSAFWPYKGQANLQPKVLKNMPETLKTLSYFSMEITTNSGFKLWRVEGQVEGWKDRLWR